MLQIKKLSEVFPCSETQKVILATYTLKDEARRWWMLIRDNNGALTWNQFREIFYEKYFPQCFRDRKVFEFEPLKQGSMPVAEYEAKFIELARFSPHMVDTDYKKARKFEGGLNLDVFDWVGVLKLPKYVNVLDRVMKIEANLAAMKQTKAPTTEWRGKRFGYNFRKGRLFAMNKKQNIGSTSSSSQSSGSTLVCFECGRKQKGVYYRATGICFRCGKTGHIIKDCLLRSDNANRSTTSSAESASAPRSNVRTNTRRETLRQGRVFTLVPGDVQSTNSVVSGKNMKII
ncbi:uncharacterized protein LOC114284983 [Camellia sinensis]|uniref:uncharacterized protein LOC114284983 n=1 Tax=Camellia sinensis TaxID=4442 RepID=UPI001035AC4E|nr:uncharacterized protein LOC114284983 [Camellia sinensis]